MFPPKELSEDEYLVYTRGKIVAVAQAILDGEIGVIAGSRKLCDYRAGMYRIADGYLDVEYFTTFESLASETDHLPVDWERKNWSDEALKKKDVEIAEFDVKAKERIFEACLVLIRRYEVTSPRT
jgi:hypothetical protein